jgi:hypothetical protein
MALSAGTAATITSATSVASPSSTVTSGHSCRAISSSVDSVRLLGLVVGSCHSSLKEKNQKDPKSKRYNSNDLTMSIK